MSADVEAPPDAVAAEIVAGLTAALPAGLTAVLAHGSWVHGDFAPGRSDLDLLVVVRDAPDDALLGCVERVLDSVVRRHPAWSNRLEIGFVTTTGMRAVIEGGAGGTGARVSPGEPLHLVPLERHQVLDWDAARRGRALVGAVSFVPPISDELVREVVEQHLTYWTTAVAGLDDAGREADGFRAYAVLTVCRARALLAGHGRVSKRAAAGWALTAMPEHAPLVRWAAQWWYDGAERPAPTGVEAFISVTTRR